MVERPDLEAHPDLNPIEYETQVYQKGLKYERPSFTFRAAEWEGLAMQRMSAESAGYVVGNAGSGETYRKNREGFPEVVNRASPNGQDDQFP